MQKFYVSNPRKNTWDKLKQTSDNNLTSNYDYLNNNESTTTSHYLNNINSVNQND